MELRTAEYNEDDRRQDELREAIETGRRYKVAGEVLKEFLYDRREEIVRIFENRLYGDDVSMELAELRIMKRFRNLCQTQIDLGELAEKELSEYGSE